VANLWQFRNDGLRGFPRFLQSGACQESRRVESGQGGVGVAHDQGNLGAAEYDCIAPVIFQLLEDLLKVGYRLGFEHPIYQLVHDDAIDLFPRHGARADGHEALCGQLFRINFTVHQPTGTGNADTTEAATGSLRGDHFRYVQPWQRRARFKVGKRLMNRVVRTDQEISAGSGKLVGGIQHQLTDALPVITIEVFDVGGQRMGMHRHFGMGVRA
jgi:hypothetical protein